MDIDEDNYKFRFAGGEHNSYFFISDNLIIYEIKFKNTTYIFANKFKFELEAFEMVIDVEENPTGKNPPLDLKIPKTIANIFNHFFIQNKENVIIYICDSSDSRQNIRRRKFNQWFEIYKDSTFYKVDTIIIDNLGTKYYNSLILKANNKHRPEIIEAFLDLAADNQK